MSKQLDPYTIEQCALAVENAFVEYNWAYHNARAILAARIRDLIKPNAAQTILKNELHNIMPTLTLAQAHAILDLLSRDR